MNSPKLDARSYAILVLAFLVTTLGVHLVAQQNVTGQPLVVSSAAETATATRAVADSTRAVAESNAQIAAAIRELAGAVREVRGSLDRIGQASASAPGDATGAEEERYAPPRPTMTDEQEATPVFELN